MFPSIESIKKEKNVMKEELDVELFSKATAIKSRGGFSDPYEQNVQDEVTFVIFILTYFIMTEIFFSF